MSERISDEDLANFIHWSEVYSGGEAFDTALDIATELRELRAMLPRLEACARNAADLLEARTDAQMRKVGAGFVRRELAEVRAALAARGGEG